MQALHGKQINFVITPDLLEEVDRIAKRTGMKRAQTIRALLYFGSDVYRDFERVGIVKLAEITDKALKSIRKEKGQQKLFT